MKCSILIAAGHAADLWAVRGIALGGSSILVHPISFADRKYTCLVIFFATILHGLTPKLGVLVMDVSIFRSLTSTYDYPLMYRVLIVPHRLQTYHSSCDRYHGSDIPRSPLSS